MPTFAKLVDHRNPQTLAASLRRRRFRLFMELVAGLPRPVRVLDVGGVQRYWEVMGAAQTGDFDVTLLNIEATPVTAPHFHSVLGDAADLSSIEDGSFDVVFSNSVIEHLGAFERQLRMAREVQRIGRRFYVQTPNRYFPIEPHFLAPFFQFFPHTLQVWLVQHARLGWYPRMPDRLAAEALVTSHRLLTAGELKRLFPGAHLFREKLFGMTKSFVVYGSR
jgi:SAM-dependent methyltransferase